MSGNQQPVALVTGGGTGIGRSVALRMASLGWRVAVNYAGSRAAAEETATACLAAGSDGLAVQGDVADDTACRRLVAATLDRWGRLDALVNNAGVTAFARADDLESLNADDFARIFAVNVAGAYQMARAAAPALRYSAGGDLPAPGWRPGIVNISSHGAFSGLGSSMAYAASKGALNTLTLALARSLAPDIRVNAVCPGFVDTDWVRRTMADEDYRGFRDRVAAISPLRRISTPDEIAEAVSWFLTCGASVTGQLLVVDAGVHLTIRTPIDS